MNRHRRAVPVGLATMATVAVGAVAVSGALGASATGASFSGGAGTATVDGKLYAKRNAPLTLTVTTDNTTKCVRVTDGTTSIDKDSGSAQTSWTFTSADSAALFTAGTGDGVKSVTATAYRNANGQHKCTANAGESLGAQTASYVLDNTGPVVTGTRQPAANPALWNNTDVTVKWSATDAGVGMDPAATIADGTVTGNTPVDGVVRSASASDRLGNTGNGSITVKVDKDLPTFNFQKSPAPNANGWNKTDVTLTFDCADALSGIKSCTGKGTQVLSSEGANLQATGQAVDNADNTATNPVTGVNIDKTAPSLSGAATTAPNAAGWYRGDVTVRWTASDGLSGLDGGTPADSTVSGEGSNLGATASVNDKAGNVTSKTVSGIQIDRTAPNTVATAPTGWSSANVSVKLTPADGLSGVDSTHFQVDGGPTQSGTDAAISGDGTHTLEFWSADVAGNVEAHKSVQVKIDGTAPTIGHQLSPEENVNHWYNSDVSVAFICHDDTSGVASCGPDRVGADAVSSEGAGQDITGTAVDNAGNTAFDHALLSIDKTPPTIKATADRDPNANHWYDGDVTVSFTCKDLLSGVDSCPAAKKLGEGENQSVSGTVADMAGNQAGDGIGDIDVDETAPELSGAATTAPNSAGWYSGDVTIHWTAKDTLSGLDGASPDDSVIQGEGANLSASATVSDKAGNSASKTVDGIGIDRTAPVTTAHVADPLDSGWYAGPVAVKLTATDPTSGVDSTYYSIDGGSAQSYTGQFDVSAKGVHDVRFWSVDKAGNTESHSGSSNVLTLKIDGVPPTIAGSRTPDANSFGWNNGDVTVSFACSDAESGIAGCTDPVTVSNEGKDQSVTGDALDNAGNDAHATVSGISIDKTPPALVGAPTAGPNAAGWYNGDVTIHWDGHDGLSGIDPATQPADSTITGEGDNLGAGPAVISDKAGNPSAAATVGGIKIDRKAPVITGKPTTAPNAAGWYNGDVVVDFTCTDNLSGVAFCPTSKDVKSNGAGQSVTSDTAEDLAGNAASGVTVGGLNIDAVPPATTSNNQCTKTNGYCTGSTANVVLTASDQSGLSGVKELHYKIDGGAEQVSAGATKTVSVPLDGSGAGTVTYWAVDNAGNAEAPNAVSLKWDNIAPTVTHTVNPTPNATGWNVSDVTVHFDAKDDDGGSGVDASTITPDQLVHDETNGLNVVGSAQDVAGNKGTDTATIRLDRTPPTVTGAIVSGTQGANGWYTGPVKVAFSCSDARSGMAVCPDPVTLTDNAAGQSVSGTATDNAGNTATAKVTGIDIDQEKPAITVSGVKDGAVYTLGAVPTASCAATDGFSGAGPCTVTTTGGLANGVGTFVFVAKASDKAGNAQQVSGTYQVVYRWDGFLQPINDTAHQIGTSTSIFKAGSTVPAKFQLKKADGTVVQSTTAPAWEVPAKGSLTTAPVDESVYGDAADSGSLFRYDSSAQQYIYNWGSPSAGKGSFYRIGVRLDDGRVYYVNAGLK